jgi:hypothetical protein
MSDLKLDIVMRLVRDHRAATDINAKLCLLKRSINRIPNASATAK